VASFRAKIGIKKQSCGEFSLGTEGKVGQKGRRGFLGRFRGCPWVVRIPNGVLQPASGGSQGRPLRLAQPAVRALRATLVHPHRGRLGGVGVNRQDWFLVSLY